MASAIVFLSPILLSILSPFLLSILSHLHAAQVSGGELILEDGYTVSTVLVGDKSNVRVNPHSILHQSPPSDLFVLLDSVASTLYTVSMPTTADEIEIQRLAGNGARGYTDGDLHSATFNRPKSFAVDFNGNVYVADQSNHVIRKITKSGVTTIAGGYSRTNGRADGPAQNASFSDNFLLTFVPERCALMISDHGNRLVRQIKLKEADCTLRSGSVLGSTSVWLVVLAVGVSCIVGIIVGFVIRPCIIPYTGRWQTSSLQLDMDTLPNESGEVIMLSLSLLALMFRPSMVESSTPHEKSISLLDIDEVGSGISSNGMVVSPEVDNQLKDLLTYGGGPLLPPVDTNAVVEQEGERQSADICSGKDKNIDDMILANLVNFEEQASRACPPQSSILGLVKRR